jgi:hypothetical protein
VSESIRWTRHPEGGCAHSLTTVLHPTGCFFQNNFPVALRLFAARHIRGADDHQAQASPATKKISFSMKDLVGCEQLQKWNESFGTRRPTCAVRQPYAFTVVSRYVAAAILAAVEGGILPPGMATLNKPANREQIMKPKSRTISLLTAVFASILTGATRADVVTDWNQTTLATQAAVAGGIRTPPASRALAMVHLAISDSVNAIDRRYRPYAVDALADPGASAEAAAAAAAYAVLVNLYPSRQADLDAAYAASLASIADGSSKTEGISVGESVAAVILALRSADGSAVTLPYTLAPGPGIYVPDPAALFVSWGNVTPFALRSGSQFRAEGPPALSSEEYSADYNEVKSLGDVNSTARTLDQTEAALFWQENSQIHWNRIAHLAADANQNSLSENARLFALLNVAIADTAIAGLDTKYTYNFWRPREAIRAGDTDGNANTIGDPAWTPLNYTGVHPDYISQHSAVGGAAAQVLAWYFRKDEFSFSITTSTAPGGVFRSYDSFSQAARENLNSRIWLGFHFRKACEDGLKQGKQVANFVVHHFLKPIKKHHGRHYGKK